ncbi:hypothetical protein BT69DRAFT_1078384 [Atractiella rhizophila]|nr:hypothetical protein BT69DRAFT_1078384 [Atractiella rhizophila]
MVLNNRNANIVLFVVPGIDKPAEEFVTRTKQEIGEIRWFPLSQLPGWSPRRGTGANGGSFREETGPTGLKCFNVSYFIAQLREWIPRHRPASISKKPSKHNRLKYIPPLEPNEPSSAVDSPIDPKLFSNPLNRRKLPPHMLQVYRNAEKERNGARVDKDRELQEYFQADRQRFGTTELSMGQHLRLHLRSP